MRARTINWCFFTWPKYCCIRIIVGHFNSITVNSSSNLTKVASFVLLIKSSHPSYLVYVLFNLCLNELFAF